MTMTVRDTGAGIPPSVLPHIFERFYQGDSARAASGSGLGLAIAKALVDGQSGTISTESRVGHGSTFTVTLPRAPQASPAEASAFGQLHSGGAPRLVAARPATFYVGDVDPVRRRGVCAADGTTKASSQTPAPGGRFLLLMCGGEGGIRTHEACAYVISSDAP